MNWPFDQAENVAAITTKFVLEEGLPILRVTHFLDDHSWAFTCGTTDNTEDARMISMAEAVEIDPTIAEVADLPPGWEASRETKNSHWERYLVDAI
jgi:hypothetical protein